MYGNIEYEMPQKLKNQNLLIEITSNNITNNICKPYFDNQLTVLCKENAGKLQILCKHTLKAICKIYIKVYCKYKIEINNQNKIEFYKDGYTDIRGF